MLIITQNNILITKLKLKLIPLIITTLVLLSNCPTQITSLNITQILSHYPSLSNFTSLITDSEIATDISLRTSLTLLAVPNNYLNDPLTSPSTLPDVIRYHVILQYLTWSDLRKIPPTGTLYPTLGPGPGRPGPGLVNLTFNPVNGVVSVNFNNNLDSINIIDLIKTVPLNLTIYTVNSLIRPYESNGTDLTALSNGKVPFPSPGINITEALINGHNFNVAIGLLTASGVISSFKKAENGAGITLFIPTDVAFSNLPEENNFKILSAEQKNIILKFHVLLSYYPLGSLESIVNPVQPTLATEDNGAGSFTLNIRKINGSVSINTGLVNGIVSQTVFDQNPIVIFGVSSVLLPKEIFGSGSGPVVGPDSRLGGPVIRPDDAVDGPLLGILSNDCGGGVGVRVRVVVLFCVGLLYVLVY